MTGRLRFTIILTRTEDPEEDEKISIYPSSQDSYCIHYRDLDSQRKWQIDTDYDGVCRYLETLVKSLKYDIIDKYNDIQVQFPMYPVLAMPVDTFCAKDFQKTFAEMFDSVMQMEFSE